jgi:glutamate synthase domain-containing protein 3
MPHLLDGRNRDLRTVSAELKGMLSDGPVTLRNSAHLHGLAAGLKSGHIVVEGSSGDYLGALNDGALIRVNGHAGRYLADNMTRGTVVVEGDAGDGVGAYCYGGTIVVKGSAGDFTAVMNKGATVLIGGSVGDEVATYMLAGDLVVLGNAGKNLGNYLIRGTIYVGGTWESLGHNTLLEEMMPEDLTKLRTLFDAYGLSADPLPFKKIVRLSEKPFYRAHEPAKAKEPVHRLSARAQ